MANIQYDANACYGIGIDIGGTKINCGLIRDDGTIVANVSVLTLAKQEKAILQAALAVEQLMLQLEHLGIEPKVRGIGIGTAGQVHFSDGSIRWASDLMPGYKGTNLRTQMEQLFHVPVTVDNDVNVLAVAEYLFGSGQGAANLLCIALGTGVGGALMINGNIVHGAWGAAGEIGHMSVDYRGRSCICGGIGCLEQYASGNSIAAIMNEKLSCVNSEELVDAKEVITRWLAGDSLAVETMQEVIAALAAAIASAIHMFNPDVITIGGGVAEAGDALLIPLRNAVRQRTMPSFYESVQIELAFMGNKSAMIGAAMQLWTYSSVSSQ
ncbi:glucokinase [Paenibacillus castaneae]|uniref:ROK family protein n=1 Tax=Paenibacillus castaneae TaxID=474957 RepID=UPI000C9C33E1|nr:ROK family protein [Paenibacillus castaneae]NIK75897.1 glucokinase [Paenibacillus castaneae]